MHDIAGCCSSGAAGADDYQPQGQLHHIGGVLVYDSKPHAEIDAHQAVVLLLPDGFGHAKHNYILADRFARNGWRTIVPDYFEGDGLPVQLLQRNPNIPIDDHDWSDEEKARLKAINLDEWTKKHSHDHIQTLLDSVISSLREENSNVPLLGVGYCFGGKHIFLLAQKGLRAAVAFHPSFVTGEDLQGVGVPVYVGLAEKDQMVPKSLPQELTDWAAEFHVDLTMETYPEVKHGFAARPEAKDPKDKLQYEKAFSRTVAFFRSHQ